MSPTETCGSCGAQVRWIENGDGRRMPLDYDASPDGNIQVSTVSGVTTIHVLRVGETPNPWHLRFTSHLVTCPNSDAGRPAIVAGGA